MLMQVCTSTFVHETHRSHENINRDAAVCAYSMQVSSWQQNTHLCTCVWCSSSGGCIDPAAVQTLSVLKQFKTEWMKSLILFIRVRTNKQQRRSKDRKTIQSSTKFINHWQKHLLYLFMYNPGEIRLNNNSIIDLVFFYRLLTNLNIYTLNDLYSSVSAL